VQHFRRWGAVYILALLFAGSWAGQLIAMQPRIDQEGWSEFWAATFENWQSEWLQLVFQAVLLLGAKHVMFKADARDLERIEAKLDRVLERGRP
jgi:hypothetical protein